MRFTANSATDYDDYEPPDEEPEAFTPGERVCAPASAGRGNTVAKIYGALAFTIVATIVALRPLPPAVEAIVGDAASRFQRTAATDDKPPPTAAAPSEPTQSPIVEQAVAPPPPVAGEPVPAASSAAAADADGPSDAAETHPDAEKDATAAAPPQPLPEPKVDPSDRLQVKALAAGLNPALSRGLLARLSSADYRNAREAIRRALGSPSGNDVVLWPQARLKRLAQFEVHFVPAASRDCRRYVVRIAKDGWATTALPMEKCGFGAG